MNYEEIIIAEAFAILARRLNKATINIGSLEIVENYLLHKLIYAPWRLLLIEAGLVAPPSVAVQRIL